MVEHTVQAETPLTALTVFMQQLDAPKPAMPTTRIGTAQSVVVNVPIRRLPTHGNTQAGGRT
ncbi:hypothetical protein [Acetobacter cibinongensis]|uniref:hypothetical protein n=1 Tax=Acetobacter cibinongensis TaxID=146475 RepID=UPI001F0B0179|nr:hypothetical protein [Acetobacter cibinongensis]